MSADAATDGTIKEKRGICGICPAGCWIKAGIRDGRLETIAPDDSHPLGMICRRGQHAPEIIYSKHRLHHPQQRVGAKDSFDFERVSWDQAYDRIVSKLNRIKSESGPEAVAI